MIGNYIGLDVTGTKALPNKTGITIYSAQYNRIGGNLPGESNLISGNREKALAIYGMGPLNAIVLGNIIGLDVNGKSLPNGNGIYTYGGTHSFIGGLSDGGGNKINGGDFGISFEFPAANFNWIAGNAIQSQNGILINNGAFHIFAVKNDTASSMTGILVNAGDFNSLRGNLGSLSLGQNANQNLAVPVLKTATTSVVSGTTASHNIIDLFVKDSLGMVYLGAVTADASGNFTFSGSINGTQVIATATDIQGNTSGFSDPLTVK